MDELFSGVTSNSREETLVIYNFFLVSGSFTLSSTVPCEKTEFDPFDY